MGYRHLDSEGLLRATYGVPEGGEAAHLAECAECAGAVKALDARRAGLAAAGLVDGLPEPFWQRQRQAILARAREPAPSPFLRAARAVSLAALLVAAFLAASGPAPKFEKRAATAPLYTLEDEQLLQDIHLMVNRIEPRALEPARLVLPGQTSAGRWPAVGQRHGAGLAEPKEVRRP